MAYEQLFRQNHTILIASHFLWIGLLLAGVISLFVSGTKSPVIPASCILVGGQWFLHLIYGHETIIYSLHWMPMLVFLAALSSATRLRPLALAGALALIPVILLNNVALFYKVVSYVSNIDLNTLSP